MGVPDLTAFANATFIDSEFIVLKPVAQPMAAHILMNVVAQPVPIKKHLLNNIRRINLKFDHTVASVFSAFIIPWHHVMILRPITFGQYKHHICISRISGNRLYESY